MNKLPLLILNCLIEVCRRDVAAVAQDLAESFFLHGRETRSDIALIANKTGRNLEEYWVVEDGGAFRFG